MSEGHIVAVLQHVIDDQPMYIVRIGSPNGGAAEGIFNEDQLAATGAVKKPATAKTAEKEADKPAAPKTAEKETDEDPKATAKKETAKKTAEKVEAVEDESEVASTEALRKKATQLVLALGKAKGGEVLKGVFKPFKCLSISELKPEQYADFIDAVEAELL